MKKITALLLAALMLLSAMPAAVSADGPAWPASDPKHEDMPCQPPENYYSQQNPPSFSWNLVPGAASYDLLIAADAEMKEIKYEARNIDKNVYAFPYVFEADAAYYWSVRYKTSSGAYSEWRKPSRFYIDADAYEFPVAEIEDIGELLKGKKHPWMLLNEEFLKEVRNLLDNDPELANTFYSGADLWYTLRFPQPDYMSQAQIKATQWDWVMPNYWWPSEYALLVTLAYLVSGEQKYRDGALTMISDLAKWKPEEIFEYYVDTDTAESIFAFNLAIIYDWMYDELGEDLRKEVAACVERNLKRPFADYGKNGKLEGSIYDTPLWSHAWRMNQLLLASLVIYEESDLAKEVVAFQYPIMMAVTYPFGYQDGASNEGPCYGLSSHHVQVGMLMQSMGVGDPTQKAWYKNAAKHMLYLWPSGWYNNFGDSWGNYGGETSIWKEMVSCNAGFLDPQWRSVSKNELNRTLKGAKGFMSIYEPLSLFYNMHGTTEAKLPAGFQNGQYFPDRGWTSLYSDVSDENKVGIIYKANPFGNNSHTHADNSSFVIQGYGEPLAVDSGYYDYYNSPFAMGYGQLGYAHNIITYDNAQGMQKYHDAESEAYVTGFLEHSNIGLTSGDAAKTFENKKIMEKSNRNIIYLKPDTFIMIDDLATSDGSEHTFEYWLNALGDIDMYQDKTGATVTKGTAALDVKVQYPQKVEGNYIDIFAGPTLSEIQPPESVGNPTDKRIYFQTEKTSRTKLVTTLDVRRKSEDTQFIKSEDCGDYLKLELEESAVAYINLTGAETVQTKDGISFSGVAFVYNKDGYLFNEGTKAVMDGIILVESDVPVSVSLSGGELAVSSIQQDANVKVYAPGVQKLTQHYEEKFREIPSGAMHNGILWNTDGTFLTMSVYSSNYSLYLNDKRQPGGEGQGVITLDIDGERKEIPFRGSYNEQGQLLYDFYFKDFDGMYVLEEYRDFSIKDNSPGSVLFLSSAKYLMTQGENPYLKLRRVDRDPLTVSVIPEPDDWIAQTAVFAKADEYTDVTGSVVVKYWEPKDPYPFKGNTLQNMNAEGQTVTWTLEVPEDGYYDVGVVASTTLGSSPVRGVELNGEMQTFVFPATSEYRNLDGAVIPTKTYLKAGKNDITFMSIRAGDWIIAYVGLIPADKPLTQGFQDMAGHEWARLAVSSLQQKGIVSGVSETSFEPGRGVAREEFVKMAAGILNTDASGETAFTDANAGEWYYPFLQKAAAAGLITGKPDGSFGIGEGLTREDMAVIVCRLLKDASASGGETFADDGEIAEYAKEAVYTLRSLNIVSGTGGNQFAPKKNVTRAEAAQIIYNLLQNAAEHLK